MHKKTLRTTYIKYLLPTLGSMVLFSTYTMVDGIFVGRGVGPEALSAVNISMPFVSLIFALAMLLSIGCSNLISYELGKRNTDKANQIFSTGIALGAFAGLTLSVLAYFNIEGLAQALGAQGELIPLVVDYLGIIVLFASFYILTYMFEIMVKADGAPRLAIIFMLISALTNIVLDYVFIYHFGWGIKGAAIATGISQALPCIFYIIYFLSKYSRLHFRAFPLSPKRLKIILGYGVPAALTELSTGATISFFNIAISKYFGLDGLAAFSVIVYILNLVVNAMISINQASQPLVTYKLGQENYDQVRQLRKMQFSAVALMSLAFFVLVQGFPQVFIEIFLGQVDPDFFSFAQKALRIFSTSFLVLGFNIGIGGYLTSVRRPKYELFISILRGYVLVFIAVHILPLALGKQSLWIALTLSELVTLVFSLTFLQKTKESNEGLH